MKPDQKNLLVRIASALVALPVVGAIVFWREPIGMTALCLVVAVQALREYTSMTMAGRPKAERACVVLIGAALYLALSLRPDLGVMWFLAAMIAVAILILARAVDLPAAGARLFAAEFGVSYIGGLLAALALLHGSPGPAWVALAIAVTFGNDTGAYFVGRAFGRHKLAPAISPGKTVEGALGGLVASLTVTFVAGWVFMPTLTTYDRVMIGLVSSIVGPAGDLVESLIKRAAGVKDSGRCIPGHGGVLDRIDALLFVSAYVYLHVNLLRR
ncbi:MAG: phosphatidate cytidylyltransferase [Polyangia bacterium]